MVREANLQTVPFSSREMSRVVARRIENSAGKIS